MSILGLLLGGAAVLLGGKAVVDTVNDMDKEDIDKLAEHVKCSLDMIQIDNDEHRTAQSKEIERRLRLKEHEREIKRCDNAKRNRLREEQMQNQTEAKIKFNLKPEDYKLFKKHVGYKNFNYKFIEQVHEYKIKITELKLKEAICKIEDEMYYCKDNSILMEKEAVLNMLYNEL